MPDGTVVIMGAGFSRAVASEMPLTDELGNLAQARAGFGAQDWWATGWTFEALLSRLAEDQPDLDEEENLLNRSRFVATAKAISSVLVERQRQAVARPAPQWLLRLVGSLHAQDTTVISFNYDTLIEAAVVAHTMLDWSTGQRVQDSDVVGHLPPNPPGTWGDDVRQTFRLLKLHGSVNWWWSPGDTTGIPSGHPVRTTMPNDRVCFLAEVGSSCRPRRRSPPITRTPSPVSCGGEQRRLSRERVRCISSGIRFRSRISLSQAC
jgi:hypothetical protein